MPYPDRILYALFKMKPVDSHILSSKFYTLAPGVYVYRL